MSNNKLNIFIIVAIMIVPIMLYSYFKSPNGDNNLIAQAAGTPMVIKFSSPMCYECKQLDKVLKNVEPKYKDKVTFQKLSVNSSDKEVQKKIKKYRVNVVPTMVLIDKNGNTVKKIEGSLPQSKLERDLEDLVNG